MRKPTVHLEKLKESKWHEYLVRFVFGGLVAAAAGWAAEKFGPVVGGLFLAFPSIFPASITLVQQHEQRKDQGKSGAEKGKDKAGDDTVGAIFGCVGLAAFGGVVWAFGRQGNPIACLAGATAAWMAVSGLTWLLQQRFFPIREEERGLEEGRTIEKRNVPAKAS